MAQISRKILSKIYDDTTKNILEFEQEKIMELHEVMDPVNIRRFLENTGERVLYQYTLLFKSALFFMLFL